MTDVHFFYNIDVIEGCNLRCPSCPVGNSREAARPRGLMSPETLGAILDKAVRETPNMEVGLFSWTEPLLHPRLADLIRVVKKHGLICRLSSNLNRIDRLEEVLAAKPDSLRISLSGFHQETYVQSHRGGDIEKVKANMRTLYALMEQHDFTTKITVGYHRYKHNMGEDYKKMSTFAKELGFVMEPVWAYLMPLEKVLSYHEGIVADTDKPIIELLAISPKEQKEAQSNTPPSDCFLRSNQMTINADGSVALCCAVFDKEYTIAADFVSTSFDELQKLKYSHDTCNSCMNHDLHKTSVMNSPDALDAIGFANIGQPLSSLQKSVRGVLRDARDLRKKMAIGTRVRAVWTRLGL